MTTIPNPQSNNDLVAITPKLVDDGAGVHLLQPKNQTLFAHVGAAPTQANFNSLLDILAAAGILKTA